MKKSSSKITFGTSGWRAIIAEDFTFHNVRIAVTAIAQYLLNAARNSSENSETITNGVVIASDYRFLSEEFMKSAAEVLAHHGIKSFVCPVGTPTPVLSFEITRRKAAGSINFTASHNPATYQGLKFNGPNGGPASVEVTSALESLAEDVASSGREIPFLPYEEGISRGLIVPIDPKDAYLERIRGIVRLDLIGRAHLKVIADLMHGNALGYLDLLLKKAEVELEVLHPNRDPLFGGQRPDPGAEELKEMIKVVQSSSAQLGLACDGDADRFGVIDGDGTFITPNEVLAILFEHLVKTRQWKGSVVRTVATTHLIDAIAKEHDIPVIETAVGFKYIAEAMEKKAVIIGGEESGGLTILGHVLEKDGILACLLIAEVVATRKMSLGEILKELRARVGDFRTARVDFELKPGQREKIVATLKNSLPSEVAGFRVLEAVSKDGTKLILSDGAWLLLRFSGTEPLLRCYFETKTLESLDRLKKGTVDLINILMSRDLQ